MATSVFRTPGVPRLALIRDEGGALYRVPWPIIVRYRLSNAERTAAEAELSKRAKEGGMQAPASFGPDFIRAIPQDVLAPYRLSGEDLAALTAQPEVQGYGQAPQSFNAYGPTGIRDTWVIQQLSSGWITELQQQDSGPGPEARAVA